tara:strand:- start:25209 stop:26156 length:948 start_codon:yes stop_codon:yes gene_type:complete
MSKKSKKYIKRGGYQKKLKKTRRSSRGGAGDDEKKTNKKAARRTVVDVEAAARAAAEAKVKAARRPFSARGPFSARATGISRSVRETFNRTKKNRDNTVKTLVQSLDVVKVEDGDDEVCHRLQAQVDGLNVLCGKLIKELNDKNMGVCNIADTQNVETSIEQEEEEDIKLITQIIEDKNKGVIKEEKEVTQDPLDPLDDEKLKKLKEKIMRTIVNAISTSESISVEELNSFINDDNTSEKTLNKDKITEYLSRLAKTKVNGMVYNIISKKIESKAKNACKSFEEYFDNDEKEILISKIREEILEKIPGIRSKISK